MKTRRAAVVVLAQGALIALRASVAWSLEALTYSADPARHDALDAGRVTIDGRCNAVRSQVVTALQHFFDYGPDALGVVINAYNETIEDLMASECACNFGNSQGWEGRSLALRAVVRAVRPGPPCPRSAHATF